MIAKTKKKINYKALNAALFEELKNESNPVKRRAIENRIVELNEKLVYRAAHRWVNYKNVPLPLDELYSIGMSGLLTALRNFKPSYGVQFSTFATNHINGAIKRTIRDKGSLVRIPQALQGKGPGQITVGSIKYISIDAEENIVNLTKTYDSGEINPKVERWLSLFKDVSVTQSNGRTLFISALNRLVEAGYIESEKIGGDSRVVDGVEYIQGALW